jgi:type I restriction-modification system DNA methylase subunit
MRAADHFVLSEIARQLHLSSPTVGNWRSRYTNFPPPIRVEGKREYWTVEQIENFMVLSGLDGRGRRSRKQNLQKIDYTKLSNLIELLSPVFRPYEAIIYLLTNAWDIHSDKPSKNLEQLLQKVSSNELISDFANVIKVALKVQKHQVFVDANNYLQIIINSKDLRKSFIRDIRIQWAQSGRERAATTNQEILSVIISKIAKGNEVLELCAGLGSSLKLLSGAKHIVAQEIDPLVSAVLSMLLDLEEIEVNIHVEDSIETLHREWLYKYDLVLAIPPSRSQGLVVDSQVSDPRWMRFDSVRLKSEEAWILNALAYLKPAGTAVIGLPTKWMTSTSSSKFRKKLVGLGRVVSSISLGHGMYNDNRIEMSLLVLSGTDKPNEKIRLVNARTMGVMQDGMRNLDESAAKGIALLAKQNLDELHQENSDPQELIVDVYPAVLVENSCPLEFNTFQMSRPAAPGINSNSLKKDLDNELERLADQLEFYAAELRTLKSIDNAITYGSEHPVERLEDISQLDVFKKTQDKKWPTFEVLPGDIYISLIRAGGKDHVISDYFPLSIETNDPEPDPYELVGQFNRVCRIRLNPERVEFAKILHIYLDTPFVKSRLMEVAETSHKSIVPVDVIKNLIVPLPPPEVRELIQKLYVDSYELDFSLFYENFHDWNKVLKQLITGMIFRGKS